MNFWNSAFKNVLMVSAVVGFAALNGYAAVDQCKPIGWATRVGRTSTAFEVTGGGNVMADTVRDFSKLQSLVSGSTPKVIYIDGTLGDGWQDRSGSRLTISGSNKTIVGLKPGTKLNACIRIAGAAKNIILRNIVIEGPGSNADQAWDNIVIEGSSGKYPSNIWVDHCEFWDGQDGNADVVKGADNVTFTWCKFGYKKRSTHNLSNLIGSNDTEPESEGKLNVTYAFNWWVAAAQRKPRCRFGNIHVMNNLMTGDANISAGTDVLGIAPGYQCRVRAERNHFINEREPIYLGLSGTIGVAEELGNKFTNTTGNTKGNGTSFTPPYDYSDFMLNVDDVESAIKAGAGATLANPTACDANYVPPTPPEPVKQKAYQAEDGTVDGGVLESSNGGFAGTGYVNFDKGGKFSVPVKVDVAGEYRIDLDFTNGSGSARDLEISAGESSVKQAFAATGSWTTWETVSFNLNLAAGENTLVFATVGGADGPNVDQFDVTLVKAAETPKDTTTTPKDTSAAPVDTALAPKDTTVAPKDSSDALSLRQSLALNASVDVRIFDLNGNLVRHVREVKNFDHSQALNSLRQELPSGMYLMQVSAPGYTRRVIVPVK